MFCLNPRGAAAGQQMLVVHFFASVDIKAKLSYTKWRGKCLLLVVVEPVAFFSCLQSGLFIWVGRNISALVGCFKKLRALYEVQLLETYKIHSTVESHLSWARKKLQRPKLKKSQTAPWKWHFSPHDFLGLQQSLCNINFSFGISMSEHQRKNLLKCTTVMAESIKVVDFDGLFLTAIFA